MKYITLILLFLPFFGVAQHNPLYTAPPAGKARIVVMYDPYERWQRTFPIGKAPLFINGVVKCRLSNGTYTSFDIDTGTYSLAAEESGNKLGKRTPVTELHAEEGTIYYLEMEIRDPFFFSRVYVRKMSVMQFEKLINRRRSRFTENCENIKPKEEGAFTNRRFFVRLPAGFSVPTGSVKDWWPSPARPLVNRFQPLLAGFEAGVKVGKNNHFVSWGYAHSRQPAIRNTINTDSKEFIVINYNTLYYAYGIALNAGNTCLLYPKAGVSSLNYILESRYDGGSGFEAGGGFGNNIGLHFEYRLSRAFSIDANWEYLNGKATFNNEKMKLNQHRLFAGVRVQF